MWVSVSHPLIARQFTQDEAEALVAQGAEPNSLMPELYSPLAHISVWGNVPVARVLLQHGADPDGNKYREQIPLHIAALNGHEELARLLVASGANVDLQDTRGQTALHVALIPKSAQDSRIPELLIELGINPQIRDADGRTAMDHLLRHSRQFLTIPPFGNMTQHDRDSQNRQLLRNIERFEVLLGGPGSR